MCWSCITFCESWRAVSKVWYSCPCLQVHVLPGRIGAGASRLRSSIFRRQPRPLVTLGILLDHPCCTIPPVYVSSIVWVRSAAAFSVMIFTASAAVLLSVKP